MLTVPEIMFPHLRLFLINYHMNMSFHGMFSIFHKYLHIGPRILNPHTMNYPGASSSLSPWLTELYKRLRGEITAFK